MNDNSMSVSQRLRHYREACALSQKQVADALNIERSTYTKYETGDSEPALNTLVRIAKIYNVSPLDLLPSPDPEESRKVNDMMEGDSPIFQLNKDERRLIALYRVLTKAQKREAQELISNISKNDQ